MKIIIFAMLLSPMSFSQTEKIACKVKLQPTGVFYNTCPRGSITDGSDVRSGPYPLLTTLVRCVRPIVECVEVTEKE